MNVFKTSAEIGDILMQDEDTSFTIISGQGSHIRNFSASQQNRNLSSQKDWRSDKENIHPQIMSGKKIAQKRSDTKVWRQKSMKLADRLYSRLPDDVIKMILSYMSAKDIQSKIKGLSKQW